MTGSAEGRPQLHVWVWRRDHLEVFSWDEATEDYLPATDSRALPGLDLKVIEECARMDCASDAIRAFRERTGSGREG